MGTGHSIDPYKIHAGKGLPSVRTGGVGFVTNGNDCSHFMRPDSSQPGRIQKAALSKDALSMLELIDRRFSTLAFCPRWVVQEATRIKSPLVKGGNARWWQSPLDELCNVGVVNRYPPLSDLRGSYTAQFEHTLLLGENGKEVLTRGSDY